MCGLGGWTRSDLGTGGCVVDLYCGDVKVVELQMAVGRWTQSGSEVGLDNLTWGLDNESKATTFG